MFDMDGLPDLLKPCRGGFEVHDRGEESLQFIQVIVMRMMMRMAGTGWSMVHTNYISVHALD